MNLDHIEALREQVDRHTEHTNTCAVYDECPRVLFNIALKNAAPELLAAAKERDRLREAGEAIQARLRMETEKSHAREMQARDNGNEQAADMHNGKGRAFGNAQIIVGDAFRSVEVRSRQALNPEPKP